MAIRSSARLSTYIGRTPANATCTYDAAGRRTGSRQYDALNRILSATHAYAYGPGTLPYEVGNFTQHAVLGTMPVFTTDASGAWEDVKFGAAADILPTDSTFKGLTVYDRDPFGYVAAQRNSSGTSAWTVPNLFAGCDTSNAGDAAAASSGFTGNAFNSCLSNGLLYQYRTDGYFDGAVTFRGVRIYDGDSQQWPTPDFYGGAAGDPMSGLGYNYANNNPASSSIRAGFAPSVGETAGAIITSLATARWAVENSPFPVMQASERTAREAVQGAQRI